jgi:hypothetical protein
MDSNPFSNSSILSALQDTLKLYSNRVGTAIAEVFPDAESVNEALRFLIRIAKESKSTLREK